MTRAVSRYRDAARKAAIRSSSGGWDMNSRFKPLPIPPEIPKAAIWSGSCAGLP